MEALISIAIMLMAIVAAMSLTTQSIKMISATRERMVASMLARESMELIRNRRDSNVLQMYKNGDFGTTNFGWLDYLTTLVGNTPCRDSNFPDIGCVAQIDPTPIGKDSTDLLRFHRCQNFLTNLADDSRCWVLTNAGETMNSDDKEDVCDGLSGAALSDCKSNIPDSLKYLYRQLKKFAGGLSGRTPYKRMSTINVPSTYNCDEMAIVTTQVVWNGRFGSRSVLLEDHLYNWAGKGILELTTERCNN